LNNISARELSILIKEYYKDNPSGGNCHIVLDDRNVSNNDINFCIEECSKNNDHDGLIIMIAMRNMRKTARLKAISMKSIINQQEIL
jgi:hypothetical protein